MTDREHAIPRPFAGMFRRREDWSVPRERDCWRAIEQLDHLRKGVLRANRRQMLEADELMFMLEGATREQFGHLPHPNEGGGQA